MLIANYAYSFRIEPVLMATCIEKSLLYINHLRIKFTHQYTCLKQTPAY